MPIKYKEINVRTEEDILKCAIEMGFINPTIDNSTTVFPTGWINIYDQNRRRLYGHWNRTNKDGSYDFDIAEMYKDKVENKE